MNIENYVTNLELSKKLKEIGIKQKSCHSYCAIENPLKGFLSEEEIPEEYWRLLPSKHGCNYDFEISAFLASELLMMLPHQLQYLCNEGRAFFRLTVEKNEDDKYTVAYVGREYSQRSFLVKRDGELITALPNLILWLHENNFITIDEINARI